MQGTEYYSCCYVAILSNSFQLTRNPPSRFLKPDGGGAYVISKPKKQKQGGGCHKSHPIRPERRVCFASTRPERAEAPSPGRALKKSLHGLGAFGLSARPRLPLSRLMTHPLYIYRYMISLDFRNKNPAGFHKQAGIIISKRCNRCTTVQPTY